MQDSFDIKRCLLEYAPPHQYSNPLWTGILYGINGVACYLEDLIIAGRNDEEHKAALQEVFTRLKRAELTTRIDKCKFFEDKVKFLGQTIDTTEVHPTETYVQSLKSIPPLIMQNR